MSNVNYDAVLTTTLRNWVEQKLVDNVFTARPLFFFLKSAGQVKPITGGARIVIPLIHATNSTVGSYSGYDTISTTAQGGISAAEYNWSQMAVTISISGIEEAQNSGESEIIGLLEAKTMQAEESLGESMNTMFFGDGTGNSGKDYLGLTTLISAGNAAGSAGNGSASTTNVGGIDASTNAYWRSYVESSAAQLTIAQMTTAYNTVSVGADQPNLILTTQALFERYESLLQPQLRFADSKTADAGFQNLLFKGAPVTYDGACTAGRMYFLNTKYLKLVGHKDRWFTPTPFVRPTNQDARVAQILVYGQLVASNRRRQGVLTGKTA